MSYYDLLQVNKTASLKEIKSSYRELAKKLHPDKQNGDVKKFQDLQHAYEVLSDEKKRSLYDIHGENFDKIPQRPTNPIFDMFNQHIPFMNFSNIFNSPFQNFNQNSNQNPNPEIKKIVVELDLFEIFTGIKKNIVINRNISCTSEECKTKSPCKDCNGKGKTVHINQIGQGMFSQTTMLCSRCQGRGVITLCKLCNGTQLLAETEPITIDIPKGISENDQLVLKGKGDRINNITSDVIIVIKQLPHPIFARTDNNLIMKKKITLQKALCGGEIELDYFDKKLKIYLDTITKPLQRKKLFGYGLKLDSYLIIEFEIEFPEGKVYDKINYEQEISNSPKELLLYLTE